MMATTISKKKVSFEYGTPSERSSVLNFLVGELRQDLKTVKKGLGITTAVGIQHLLDYAKQNKLTITFNYSEGTCAIVYEPAMIPETIVDKAINEQVVSEKELEEIEKQLQEEDELEEFEEVTNDDFEDFDDEDEDDF
jgi:hypothetical protein